MGFESCGAIPNPRCSRDTHAASPCRSPDAETPGKRSPDGLHLIRDDPRTSELYAARARLRPPLHDGFPDVASPRSFKIGSGDRAGIANIVGDEHRSLAALHLGQHRHEVGQAATQHRDIGNEDGGAGLVEPRRRAERLGRPARRCRADMTPSRKAVSQFSPIQSAARLTRRSCSACRVVMQAHDGTWPWRGVLRSPDALAQPPHDAQLACPEVRAAVFDIKISSIAGKIAYEQFIRASPGPSTG
jgi:hypothetical protein